MQKLLTIVIPFNALSVVCNGHNALLDDGKALSADNNRI